MESLCVSFSDSQFGHLARFNLGECIGLFAPELSVTEFWGASGVRNLLSLVGGRYFLVRNVLLLRLKIATV